MDSNEITSLPPEIEALALRALASLAESQLKMSKATFGHDYSPGDSKKFRSPVDDMKLGEVYKTDPDPAWKITDRAALLAELATFPGNMVTRVEIVGDEAEVLAVLDTHAPHLLKDIEEVNEEAVQAALDQSIATGKPAAAGITKEKPGGVLTVKPDKDAALAIEGLVRTGLLRWDGTRALPAADERRAS